MEAQIVALWTGILALGIAVGCLRARLRERASDAERMRRIWRKYPPHIG